LHKAANHARSSAVREPNKRPSYLVVIAFFVFLAGFKASPAERSNAILVSWDGALREHVQGALAAGRLPSLARLIRNGSLVDVDVVGHGTDTKSGHAQMLTGYDPQVTGVYSNNHYRAIPAGFTVFERLHQAFGTKAITTIMLTSKDKNLGSRGPGLLTQAEPYHLVRAGITLFDGDQNRSANVVGNRAVEYIDRFGGGRFFLFVHFSEVDASGHKHGESSPEYDRALELCDKWLGAMVAELEKKGIDDRTLVYVTADHGFDRASKAHANASHVFLATNDPRVKTNGEQRDITPTVLSAMGVDVSKLHPPLPGKSLARQPLSPAAQGHVAR
jgi:predicted AlkP superfamily pyrophosphatase or phosphodiesterase